jgi:hypothetical protein
METHTVASITPEEADRILKAGFPSLDDLKRFPFGKQLSDLYSREDEDGRDFRVHAPKVLNAMNTLLSNEPERLIHDINRDDQQRFSETKLHISKLFSSFDDNAQAFFRIAALYHDVGKYIIRERHPTIGWYTLEYLRPEDKKTLRSLLGEREDYLQLLLIMVRDHDEFGVLSTGEASYPILLRPAHSLGHSLFDQKRIISAIMWLNLADMAGTPGIDLFSYDLHKVLNDLEWFLNALDHCSDGKERLDHYVIKEASKERHVVRRISRLLLEASRDIPSRIAELRQPSPLEYVGSDLRQTGQEEWMVHRLVRQQLETVYSTQIPRRNFAREFTHICKLDYGKRFFKSLAEYCEGPQSAPGRTMLPHVARERIDTENLIYFVLAILRRMSSTYSAMERIEGEVGNLIGIEMKDLTPRNAPEKTAQIIDLLIKSHYPGLSWMMSDCLAWYF